MHEHNNTLNPCKSCLSDSWFIYISFFALLLFASPSFLFAQQQVLDPDYHHIRSTEQREWSIYPEVTDRKRYEVLFDGTSNSTEATLKIRQRDVKQRWSIFLNGTELGSLHLNESDITGYFPIPAGVIADGSNTLVIEQSNSVADDILLGDVSVFYSEVDDILNDGRLDLQILDADSGLPVPSRITITNHNQSLQTTGASPTQAMAVRPGVIYTGNGQASFSLPAGTYMVYAGRGMEYGVDSVSVTMETDATLLKTLTIQKQVDTDGYISSDTHTHTYTYSGHGDATTEERVITIAGEGIEWPIATDHNIHIDYGPAAEKTGVSKYFTPVTGNEVTTRLGHFNVFPTSVDIPVPHYQSETWDALFNSIYNTPDIQVVILNHGRDVHGGFVPLGPETFNELTGEFRDGWNPEFNAMEVINSGAHQTDMMQLYRDWFTLLNRGHSITPVAGSDAHDVTRYILGQSRLYVRYPDNPDPSEIDTQTAVNSVVNGEVNIGMGLFTDIKINDRFGPGSLATVQDSILVDVTVQGPDWTTAESLQLFRNGKKIDEISIKNGHIAGLKWQGNWTLKNMGHDSFIVAIATGPGVEDPFWPIGRPWLPDSPVWEPLVIGSTGAVWLDEDGDGEKTSAFGYGRRLAEKSGGDLPNLLASLQNYDEAVGIQAAAEFFRTNAGITPAHYSIKQIIENPAIQINKGFLLYVERWTDSVE